jgi:uncharacterized protein (TIGR00369 family)
MEFSENERIDAINKFHVGSALENLNIRVIQASKDKIVAIMPIGPQHRQPLGYLHGGISIALAEQLASVGSMLNIDMSRQGAFGLEINASHLRSKREGQVTATATPLRLGRTMHVWDVRIADEDERLICVTRCTIAIVERPNEKAESE